MAQESRLAIVIDSKSSEDRTKALEEALRALEAAGIRVTGISADATKNIQAMGSESNKSARGVSDMGKSADTAASSIGGMAVALASVVSAAKLWQQIEKATFAAGRYEQIGIIMEVVGRNAGYSAGELMGLQQQLESTGISMTQSRQVITQMIQAQMDLGQATQMARLAQDAATIGNISSSEALQRLVYGVQTAQTEILRNIGIVVNFENAYKALADELGKTTSSLTEQEKMQARVNAVMEQGGAIAGAYGASMENANKQMGSMARLQEDLNVLIGQMYQPAFAQTIEIMSAGLKGAQEHSQALAIGLAGVTAAAATATTGVLATTYGLRALRIAMAAVHGHPVAMTLSLIAGGAAAVYVAFSDMGGAARIASIDIDELTSSLESLNQEQLAFRQQQAGEKLEYLEEKAAEAARELQGLERDYEALLEMFEQGRGVDAKGLENVNKALVEQRSRLADANQEVEKAQGVLQELDNAARIAAGGVNALNDALNETDEAGKKFLERLSDRAIVAGLKTQREQLDAMVDAGKLIFSDSDLKKAQDAADHIDRMNASTRTATKTTDAFATSLKSLLDTHLPHNKALNDLNSGLAILDRAHKTGKVSAADYEKAIASVNAAYARQIKDLLPESVKKANEQVKVAQDQIKALQQQVRTYGMAESAVMRLAVADTDAAIATLESAKASEIAGEASADRVREIELQIEALTQLRDLQTGIASEQQNLEFLTHQQQTWDQWARDVEQIFDRVGQSLTDAIFDGGKSGKELLKDIFKSLTFNVLINPIMGALQGSITNSLGGLFGFQNPSQQGGIMGAAQNANSMNTLFGAGYQALTGASAGASPMSLAYANTVGAFGGDPIGALISANGGWEGALTGLSSATSAAISAGAISAAPSVVASLSTSLGSATMATTSFSASLGGGAAAAGAGGAAAGTGGLLAGISAAAPWIAGGLAIASAFGLFDDEPKTRHGKSTTYELTGGDSIYRKHDEMRHEDAYYRSMEQMTQAAIDGITSTFDLLGVDATLGNFWSRTDISTNPNSGEGDGVSSGGAVMVGGKWIEVGIPHSSDDTKFGVGGWSDEPVLPRLALDLQLTMLEAFQAASEELPTILAGMLEGVDIRGMDIEAAQALAVAFDGVIQQVGLLQSAVEILPFESLRDLSFDAAANLIHFAGGLEALDAGMTSYFQNFYTEAEQLEWQTQQLSGAFESLGLEMPDVTQGADSAKSAYRELVEAQDVNTEAGAQAYAMLMTLSGGFAELVTSMDEVYGAAGQVGDAMGRLTALASQLSRAMQLVTTGGNLSDRLGAMLGHSATFAAQREQQLWATIGEASYDQQIQMSGELTDLVLGRISKEQEAEKAKLAGIQQQITGLSRMRDLGASLQNYLRSLESGDLAPYSLGEKVGHAERELADLVAAARGGDEDAMRQVQGSLQNTLKLWRDYGASGAEYEAAYHRLTGMVGNLADAAVSDAERQIRQLEAQSASLSGISGYSAEQLEQLQQLYDITTAATEAAQAQEQMLLDATRTEIDHLESMGLDTARLHDIAELLQGLPASLAAQLSGTMSVGNQYMLANPDVMRNFEQYGASSGLNSSEYALDHYDRFGKNEGRTSREFDYLMNNPDVLSAFEQGAAGSLSAEAWAKYHWDTYGQYEVGQPGRASFMSGTPFVQHDMTADIHRGEIIIDPRSSDILRRYGIGVQGKTASDGEVVAELRAINTRLERIEAQDGKIGSAQVAAINNSAERIGKDVGSSLSRKQREDVNARSARRQGVLA